jgi:SynChlorMet cassette radical SAM/SPASM protein ScmF
MDLGEKEKTGERGYPLDTIYFYLTEGCNLRCRHCWIDPGHQTESRSYRALDIGSFRTIIEQAKPMGLSSVKLTGGEPLLHPGIHEIIELIRQKDLRLTMETNGTLCTPELCREMVGCKTPSVGVSLDGANAETHEWVRGVKGCFQATLEGIRNLGEAGLKPQVIMTLMRRNRDQIEAMVRLAESVGAHSVKFNLMQPTARGEKMHQAGRAVPTEELVQLGRWVEKDLSTSTDLKLYYHQPLAFRPLGRMFGENGDGCARCGILGIIGVLANGSYALCGIGEVVPELVFGHVETDPLREVWESHPLLLEIREGMPHRLEGICGACFMKKICRGSCIAQNYYRHKSLWSSFWYCQEAQRLGLFPKSRIMPETSQSYENVRFKDRSHSRLKT